MMKDELIHLLEIYAETDKQVSQEFYQGLCLKAKERIADLEAALKKIKSLKGGEGWDLLHCKRIATKALKGGE